MHYDQTQGHSGVHHDQPNNGFTKSGPPSKKSLTPIWFLITENILFDEFDNILVCGYGREMGVIDLVSQHPDCEFWLTEIDYPALRLVEKTFQLDLLTNAHVSWENTLIQANLPKEKKAFFDAVIMLLPKGRKLARKLLVEAHQALKPEGNFFLIGSNNEGVQAVCKDATELFGKGSVLAYKKGSRIFKTKKSHTSDLPPAWAVEPGIAPGTWLEFNVQIKDQRFTICSLPGVFSYEHLDEGTELLLHSTNLQPGATILDMGCGNGIIGLYASKLGAASVDMVDSNLYAICAARKNIEVNGLKNITAMPGDLYEAVDKKRYDLVLSNPPFHTGKEVNYQVAQALIHGAYDHLNKKGRLVVVANRFIRYDHWMQEVFKNIEVLSTTSKYHVLSSTKR